MVSLFSSIPFGVKALISGLLFSHKARCLCLFVEWGITNFRNLMREWKKGWGGDESIIY